MSSTVPHQSQSALPASVSPVSVSSSVPTAENAPPFADGAARPRPIKTPRLSADRLQTGPSRESLERLHNEAEALVQPFALAAGGKSRVDLGRTDLMRGMVHLFKQGGGEPRPHYHSNTDCFWLVLKGRVRFLGASGETLGEFGPQEGAIMPAYARYRFENVGDSDLQMLQVLAFRDRDRKDSGRVDLAQ
ncbi:MAG: cupin domain-containing protein [Alphaproteobacteria bacterium]